MTREALEELVYESTGRRDKTSLVRSALDIAVEELSSQRLWSDLQVEAEATLTVDSPSVALASDVARVSEVRLIDDTNSRPLRIRPKTWLVTRFPSPESRSSGRPIYGYIEGQLLYVMPLPDQAYKVRYTYYRLHPALNEATSEVLIRGADKAVAAYATFWVFQSLEKSADAERWLAIYERLVDSAKKVDMANSAIKQEATGRDDVVESGNDYWLDPFVKRMP